MPMKSRSNPPDGGKPTVAPQWSAQERESFFAAIERHRRAAWRVSLVSTAADVAIALVIAALMSPLFYAALLLLLDLVNLIVHVPNMATVIGAQIRPLLDAPGRVPVPHWVFITVLAVLPGFVWMTLVTLTLRRLMTSSAIFNTGGVSARVPNPLVLEEQTFANVVGEMAVAAGIPPPKVLIVDQPGLNAAVFGPDDKNAMVVFAPWMLTSLGRSELQAVAAHLVGSVANGDMAIGLHVANTLCLFGLFGQLSGALDEQKRPVLRLALSLCLAAVLPGRRAIDKLAGVLADPFGATRPVEAAPPERRGHDGRRDDNTESDWRTYIWLPVAGPIVMSAFFGTIVSMFILGPLVALAWRQRKYMADATAVRLLRDPDALASALQKIGGGALDFAPWASHFAVAGTGRASRGLLESPVVPMLPSLDRRLRGLASMGAHVTREQRHMPLVAILIFTPLIAVMGLLAGGAAYLLILVSVALSALFLGLPVSILHLLLRWMVS
jgi:Zn-dependent protease with chaperone function